MGVSSSTFNSSRILLVKITLFLIMMAAIDRLVGGMLRHYYFTQSSGQDYRTTYAMNETTADIVILGASHATHQYDPRIIGRLTGLTAYNAGRDGTPVFYQEAVLKVMLSRYEPRIVILDVAPGIIAKIDGRDARDKLASLLPYYGKHPQVDRIIMLRGPLERLKLLSRTYPFNSLLLSIVVHNGFVGDKGIQGYLPLKGRISPKHANPEQTRESVRVEAVGGGFDDEKKASLEAIIEEVRRRGNVKLVVVVSPYYVMLGSRPAYFEALKDILHEKDVVFWDYSSSRVMNSRADLFRDYSHLNEAGAAVFSEIIGTRIKEDIIRQR